VTITTLLRVIAWLLLAGLIFATLSPIDLRPVTPLPVQLERSLAVAVIGFVFAIAYPRHIWLAAALVLGAIVLLEMLQLVTPTRHGRITDAAVKVAGACVGLLAGWLISTRFWSRGHGR
jgi:VanZ family protein